MNLTSWSRQWASTPRGGWDLHESLQQVAVRVVAFWMLVSRVWGWFSFYLCYPAFVILIPYDFPYEFFLISGHCLQFISEELLSLPGGVVLSFPDGASLRVRPHRQHNNQCLCSTLMHVCVPGYSHMDFTCWLLWRQLSRKGLSIAM